MTGMTASCFGSSRANKAATRARPIFATVFAAGATLFCTCGVAAPALGGEARRAGLPAPPALHGFKINTNESALDLKRTEVLLATYLCPIADYVAEITRRLGERLGFSTDASAGNLRGSCVSMN
jgi:hypothetical protein